jgi:tetratricopeptide (TPR) repeat protein
VGVGCLTLCWQRGWATRLEAGDHAAFRAYLLSESDKERRDFMIFSVLADSGSRADWVDRWVQEEPTCALAHMVQGVESTRWAWHARSGLQAEYVKKEQFERFFERLEAAWGAFERAIELDAEEASIYTFMIDAAMGLQLDQETRVSLFEAAQARRPWQQRAHFSMIQALSKKWSGTAEAMLDFAAYTTEHAPIGSCVHVVMPEAHVEMWLDAGDSYWRTPGVRESVILAAERSIYSPDLDPSPWLPRVRNAFAYCFWRLGELKRAREQFELVGPIVAGPFRFSAHPLSTATIARRDAGALP